MLTRIIIFAFTVLLISVSSCTDSTVTVTVPAETQTETTTSPSNSSTVHEIVIGETGFVPDKITVKTGDTVVWSNDSKNTRSIVSLYHFQDEDDVSHLFFGETWVTGDINPGESFSRVFDAAGSFEYVSLPLSVRLPMDQYRDFARAGVGFVVVE
jgi:plastocyanin